MERRFRFLPRGGQRIPLTATAVLVCILATGCHSEPDKQPAPSTAQEPPLGAIAKINQPEQVKLPRDAYSVNSEQQIQLANIQNTLLNKCLVAQGGTGDAPLPENLSSWIADSDSTAYFSTVWGFFDPDQIQSVGFRRKMGGQMSEKPGSSQLALVDKCREQAQNQMPYKKQWMKLSNGLNLLGFDARSVSADSRYMANSQKWSSCMKAAGYEASDPRNIGKLKTQAPEPGPDELKAVAADLKCKRETDYMTQVVAIQTAYENEFIKKHQNELSQFKTTIDDFIRANS